MTIWIGLFRGINVGGNNILPMAELKRDLESLKLKNVRTYIQSGNVVFETASQNVASLNQKITGRIDKQHGFRPHLLLLQYDDLRSAINSNPFPKAVDEPKSLYFFFLAEPATAPNLEAIEALKSPTENYQLQGSVFYLHAPDGIGRSKLAAKAEKHLGIVATARNYRTVAKLFELVAKESS